MRALLEEMDGDLVALYRVVSADDIVFSDELDRIAAERGAKVNYVVGDHASAEGRDLLSPRAPPGSSSRTSPSATSSSAGRSAMIDSIVPNLRHANVPRRHLHVERFAL